MAIPDSFWWGSGAPSEALLGPAPASDVRGWLGRDEADPSRVDPSVPEVLDHLAALAQAGLRHVRFVLDWARLEPEPGRHDPRAIEQAMLVLQGARDLGISMWGCLHDGSLPGWFAVDEHGFADARTRQYLWPRHVEFAAEAFGHMVHGWVPVFEPNRWAAQGWIAGTRPPGRRDDAKGFAEALEAVQLATVDAALRLRQDGRPVASAQWLPPVFPARVRPDVPASAEAEVMAGLIDEVHRGSWLRMLDEGRLAIPNRGPVEVPDARGAFDIFGFTYRHAFAVRADGALLPYPQAHAVGPDGQVPWAEGLGLVLHQLADARPDDPLLVAGVASPTTSKGAQEQLTREVLVIAEDAVADGIDLQGLWWDQPLGAAGSALLRADGSPTPAGNLAAAVAHGAPVPR